MPELRYGRRLIGRYRAEILCAVLALAAGGWARAEEAAPAVDPALAAEAAPDKPAARPGYCATVTKAGNPCSRKARYDSAHCTQHARILGEEVVTRTESAKAPVKGEPREAKDCPVFVALDVETADAQASAPCSLALIRFEGGREVKRVYSVLNPEIGLFNPVTTRIHKITQEMAANAPTFPAFWKDAAPLLEGATFIAAHNAGFDRAALIKVCARYGLEPPTAPYVCSSRAAKALEAGARLKDACEKLGIELDQHHAASDAAAGGEIVVRAFTAGFAPEAFRLKNDYKPSKKHSVRSPRNESENPAEGEGT